MSFGPIQAVGLEEVTVRFRDMPPAVRRALEQAVTVQALKLVRYVQEEKLSGQVLGQRTGRLRNAVHMLSLDRGADSVEAAVGVNLSDAGYAAFWEYGFTGVEHVREHLRMVTKAFGKPISPREVTVRAHDRHVDQAPRSYLRSALADQADEIRTAILAAVNGAASGGASA